MKVVFRIIALSAALAVTLLAPVQAWGLITCYIECPEEPYYHQVQVTSVEACCGEAHMCPSGGTGYGTMHYGRNYSWTLCPLGEVIE
jgi:hypothetical protein